MRSEAWGVFAGIVLLSLNAYYALAFGTSQLLRPAFRTSCLNIRCVSMKAMTVVNETSMDDCSVSQEEEILSPFDPLEWQEYESTVRAVVDTGRMMTKKDSPEDFSRALDYLLDNRSILSVPALTEQNFRSAMVEQKQNFFTAANMTKKQHELAMRTLTYMGDHCAKQRTPTPLIVAWYKLKEAGMIPRENCISTYMYVLSLQDTSATGEVATFHDLFYGPNEKTITLRIKSMIANEDAAAAEQLLGSLPNMEGEWKRLRTHVPVLNLYCKQGDMASALRLYRQMRELPRVHFEPDTYALLIGALAENGWFRTDSQPIPAARELGFSEASGPGLFDELAAEMAADILELNKASARVIYNGFVKGFAGSSVSGKPRAVSEFEEIVVDNTPAAADELVISHVSLNDSTAICPKTQTKLELFRLNSDQRRNVHDTLLKMAGIQYAKFIRELEIRFKENMQESEASGYAIRELSRFSDWLNERDGEPFTAIVDGANVAYFEHGNVHYSQVKVVVDELERMNEHPLVIMPQKYTASKFHTNHKQQELSGRDLEVLNELLESGKMYTVPSKCLDDYYWMLASVSNQTLSRDNRDMHVLTSDSDGRFPGLRPMLITNDQMRDHKWELLEPRLFRRWCSCHIVNYNLTEFVEDEWEERTAEFCAADFFSHEIQGNPSPGGEVDSACGLAWHFPVSEWDEHDRLCVRVPF